MKRLIPILVFFALCVSDRSTGGPWNFFSGVAVGLAFVGVIDAWEDLQAARKRRDEEDER